MFEYFHDNYPWSAAVMCALAMGGEMHEIHEACASLRSVSSQGHADSAVRAWAKSWTRQAEALEAMADQEQGERRRLSAGSKYLRASIYYQTAERQLGHESAEKITTYNRSLAAFRSAMSLMPSHRVQIVDIPYLDSSLPAIFAPAESEHLTPCLVIFNGTDSTKEMNYLFTHGDAAQRGISLLVCDQPGSGGAIRHNGLTTRFDMEVAATSCVDWLQSRPDVDSERIGVAGLSLGGYFAPRAAAFEKRLACCVAWGAIWDLPRVVNHLFAKGTSAVPHSVFPWILGCEEDEVMAAVEPFKLEGVMDRVECPMLVMHGESDRQVPLWAAHNTFNAAVNSPTKDLKIFTASEGGAEHCQFDLVSNGTSYMLDWVAGVFHTARVPDELAK